MVEPADAAWRLARRLGARLKREGVRGLAVSGSLARGDFIEGSDVDLWAVGSRSGREERFYGALPATIFFDRPEDLLDLRWVARWDVPQLVVLFDDAGDFARLAARCRRRAAQLRAHVEAGTREALEDARRRARSPHPRERVMARRELRWLGFATSFWRATGIHVPRWRHAQAALARGERGRLTRALGLDGAARRRLALRPLVRDAPGWISAFVRHHFGERLEVPRWRAAEARLASGAPEEAVLKVRSELDRWLAHPVRERLPGVDVVSLLDAEAPRGLARLFRLAHGLPPRPGAPLEGGTA